MIYLFLINLEENGIVSFTEAQRWSGLKINQLGDFWILNISMLKN